MEGTNWLVAFFRQLFESNNNLYDKSQNTFILGNFLFMSKV